MTAASSRVKCVLQMTEGVTHPRYFLFYWRSQSAARRSLWKQRETVRLANVFLTPFQSTVTPDTPAAVRARWTPSRKRLVYIFNNPSYPTNINHYMTWTQKLTNQNDPFINELKFAALMELTEGRTERPHVQPLSCPPLLTQQHTSSDSSHTCTPQHSERYDRRIRDGLRSPSAKS